MYEFKFSSHIKVPAALGIANVKSLFITGSPESPIKRKSVSCSAVALIVAPSSDTYKVKFALHTAGFLSSECFTQVGSTSKHSITNKPSLFIPTHCFSPKYKGTAPGVEDSKLKVDIS